MDGDQNRILIVDDERFNVNLLVELLKPDYKLMVAKNGEQALKAAASANQPDLVLLDIMMPEMDGYEVCRRLKADEATRDIPVIFISAMSEETDETKGLEIGAVDYITKPISPAIVRARVKTHLTIRNQMQELQRASRIIESQNDRMHKELEFGRQIQMSMVPSEFPERPDLEIHGTLRAARELGGDFYDFFFLDEETLCFCLGDVSGKGAPAALFMAVAKTQIKTQAGETRSPAEVMTRVNQKMSADNHTSMFVSLFLAMLNLKTGEITFTNAGHNPPYVLRKGGGPEWLTNHHGPILAVLEEFVYPEEQIRLEKGDVLFLYTDGVTEAEKEDHSQLGDEALAKVLAGRPDWSAREAVEGTLEAVGDFVEGAEQADDITMLAVRWLGS